MLASSKGADRAVIHTGQLVLTKLKPSLFLKLLQSINFWLQLCLQRIELCAVLV